MKQITEHTQHNQSRFTRQQLESQITFYTRILDRYEQQQNIEIQRLEQYNKLLHPEQRTKFYQMLTFLVDINSRFITENGTHSLSKISEAMYRGKKSKRGKKTNSAKKYRKHHMYSNKKNYKKMY